MHKSQSEPIPIEIRRRLLIESGFKCSIPQCQMEWPTLQFHHIDRNPVNHNPGNLLVLCPACYQKASIDLISPKTCEALKKLILELCDLKPSHHSGRKSNILYYLLAELSANLHLISNKNSQKKDQSSRNGEACFSYPRMRHIVLDEALASGVFIYDHDLELFNLLYDLSTNISDLNHRLDLVEYRLLPHQDVDHICSQAYSISRQRCIRVIEYILANYGQILEVDEETEFFGTKLKVWKIPERI